MDMPQTRHKEVPPPTGTTRKKNMALHPKTWPEKVFFRKHFPQVLLGFVLRHILHPIPGADSWWRLHFLSHLPFFFFSLWCCSSCGVSSFVCCLLTASLALSSVDLSHFCCKLGAGKALGIRIDEAAAPVGSVWISEDFPFSVDLLPWHDVYYNAACRVTCCGFVVSGIDGKISFNCKR